MVIVMFSFCKGYIYWLAFELLGGRLEWEMEKGVHFSAGVWTMGNMVLWVL